MSNTDHYKNGFKDAGDDMRRNSVIDMYDNRIKAFVAAAQDCKADYDVMKEYRAGYNDAMEKHIMALGASQAAHDRGRGAPSTKLLESHLTVIKWLKEPEHEAAYKLGYENEAQLEREPLEISPLHKKQDNIKKMEKGLTAHKKNQHKAYEEGYKDSSSYAERFGIKNSIERMTAYFKRIMPVWDSAGYKQYVEGYKVGVRDQVHQLAENLATSVVKEKGAVEPKVQEHFKMARESLNKELLGEFSTVYRGTLRNISRSLEEPKLSPQHQKEWDAKGDAIKAANKELVVGDKIEVKQQVKKLDGPSLSR